MDHTLWSVVLALMLFALLASGLWVALSLALVGAVTMAVFTTVPAGKVLASTVWSSSISWTLVSLPLFIWMAEILFRTRLSEALFAGLSPWLSRIPGGLIHVNVLGSALFAAVCGSSSATCATVGKMSIPELNRLGYDERVTIGTLCASGTLGLLIPPSIGMIVFGVVANVSIAKLFIAGMIPGALLVLLLIGSVVGWSLLHRNRMPPPEPSIPLLQRLYRSRHLLPVVFLVIAVLGSIYGGIRDADRSRGIGCGGRACDLGIFRNAELAQLRRQRRRRHSNLVHARIYHRRRIVPVYRDGLLRHSALFCRECRGHAAVANRTHPCPDGIVRWLGVLPRGHVADSPYRRGDHASGERIRYRSNLVRNLPDRDSGDFAGHAAYRNQPFRPSRA